MTPFLTWWFDTHWIWATLLTPFTTLLWAIYTNSTAWAFGCVAAMLGHGTLKAWGRKR